MSGGQTMQIWCYGEVPKLSNEEEVDLLAPFSAVADEDLRRNLTHQIERAARHLVSFFAQSDPMYLKAYNKDYVTELRSLAADPARAIDAIPKTVGASDARQAVERRATCDPTE